MTIISHEPLGWARASRYLHTRTQARWMGFVGPTSNLPRFRARYRAAHAFESVSLNGYAPVTIRAYSAMIRLMLTWSAFEFLLPMIGIPKTEREKVTRLADKYEADAVLSVLRTDKCQELFKVVYSSLDQDLHKKRVERFLQGDEVSPIYLAAVIRHAFAHGYLSPGDRQNVTVTTCRNLCELLFRIMDGEFSDRIRRYHEEQVQRTVVYPEADACDSCQWWDVNCSRCAGSGLIIEPSDDDIPI